MGIVWFLNESLHVIEFLFRNRSDDKWLERRNHLVMPIQPSGCHIWSLTNKIKTFFDGNGIFFFFEFSFIQIYVICKM